MYTVIYYTDKQGKSPYIKWLESLSEYTQSRIEARIDRLRVGNLGDTRPVGEGVHEIRLQFGPGYRVYFGNMGKRIILLLCGGDKSSQVRDIEYAKKYFKDYKERQTQSE